MKQFGRMVKEPANWLVFMCCGALVLSVILMVFQSLGMISREVSTAVSLGAYMVPIALAPFVILYISRRHGMSLRKEPHLWLLMVLSVAIVSVGVLTLSHSAGWISREFARELSTAIFLVPLAMTPFTLLLGWRDYRIEMAKIKARRNN